MSPVEAVLFDRDGTLVHDVPYNGDPGRVRPVDGAREAVALLREHGIRVGVVTNQSGIARGLISDIDVRRLNRRVDELIGPFDVWAICPHGPDDGCHCRKPRPGLVLWAAGRVRAAPADCVVIGDIGADVEAARRAGAHGILVPNERTRPEETAAADHVAPDLLTAVRALLTGPPKGRVLVNERPVRAAFGTGGGDGTTGTTVPAPAGPTAAGRSASDDAPRASAGPAARRDRTPPDRDAPPPERDRAGARRGGDSTGPRPDGPGTGRGRPAAGTGEGTPGDGTAAPSPVRVDTRGRPR
ncbi:hypothetical protein GCM10010216_46020 [Streptomyces flaveolus]|nr:hypothetical protein GCM10010216_46020 [Streptomyces flaveolus]